MPVGKGGGLGSPLNSGGGGGGGPGIIAFYTLEPPAAGAPGAAFAGAVGGLTGAGLIFGFAPAALRALSTASRYLTGAAS